MTLRIGEVVLIRMQFQEAAGAKIRPALVLLDTADDDFVAAPVTSQQRLSPFDLQIADWRAAGLNVASYARIHKLTVLSKAEVIRRIGTISPPDSESLQAVLCRAFCPRTS